MTPGVQGAVTINHTFRGTTPMHFLIRLPFLGQLWIEAQAQQHPKAIRLLDHVRGANGEHLLWLFRARVHLIFTPARIAVA